MTRPPEIKNKTNRLVYAPITTSEMKLAQDAKALCVQDGITVRDLLSEALELVFKVHHWPPGNPQLTLETCMLPQKQHTPHCRCGKVAVKHGVHQQNRIEQDFCVACFRELPMRYDCKVWRFRDL